MKHFKGTIQRLNALKGEAWRKLLDLTAQFMPDTNKPEAEIMARKQYSGFWIIRKGFSATMRPIIVLYRHLYAKARVVMGHKAQASAVHAETIEIESAIQTATETPLSCASAKSMQVHRKERVSVQAALSAYRRAGLAYFRRLFFGVLASPGTAPGKNVPAYRGAMRLQRKATAEAADSAIVESNTRLQTATEARGAVAGSETVPAVSMSFSAKHTAQPGKAAVVGANISRTFQTRHSARMATWMEPVLIDGVLYIRQAYSATMNNGVLEVR